MHNTSLQYHWLTTSCLQLHDPAPVCPERHQQLLGLSRAIQLQFAAQLQDVVLAYNSLTLHFNANVSSAFRSQLRRWITQQNGVVIAANSTKKTHVIPVYYGREVALDAEYLQEKTGLSWQQIIELHTMIPESQQPRLYHAYASGFTPGFAYLGTLPSALHAERLANPRAKIPAGSVAIAADQTAVYPSNSPGGWIIIGKTPTSLIKHPLEIVIHPGDTVQFVPINKQAFLEAGGEIDA